MSAIFGIIDFQTKPLDPSWIRSMTDQLSHRGPDGIRIAENDTWALGHALLAITPEAQHDLQPLRIGTYIITADARLDDRPALMDRLEIAPENRPKITDAEMILRNWLRYGPEGLNFLYGDFAFVIWDTVHQRGVAVRDQVGVKPLLYTHQNKQLVFSSELKALVRLPCVETRLDLPYLQLTATAYVDDADRSCWEHIHRLPAAHWMEFSSEGIRIHRYWQARYKMNPAWKDESVAIDHFRKLMTVAVRDRMHTDGPIGIPLSGGLDSSSIATLAATPDPSAHKLITVSAVLAKEQGARSGERGARSGERGARSEEQGARSEEQGEFPSSSPLTPHHSPLQDESPYISALLRTYPEIEDHYITPDELSFMDTLDEVHDRQYTPVNYFYYLDEAIQERFHEQGVRRVLSGYLGDMTVSNWQLDPLPWLIRSGRWKAAWRLIANRRRAKGEERGARSKERGARSEEQGARSEEQGEPSIHHPPSTIHHFPTSTAQLPTSSPLTPHLSPLKELLKAYLPSFIWALRDRWQGRAVDAHIREMPLYWSKPAARLLRRKAKAYRYYFSWKKGPVEEQLWSEDVVPFFENMDTGPGHHQVEVTYPWADRRIIEFLMELPLEHLFAGGRSRGLIREAMQGLLPDQIRLREDKLSYSPAYPELFFRDRTRIDELFFTTYPRKMTVAWLNLPLVKKILDEYETSGEKRNFVYKEFFVMQLVVYLSFIDQFDNVNNHR